MNLKKWTLLLMSLMFAAGAYAAGNGRFVPNNTQLVPPRASMLEEAGKIGKINYGAGLIVIGGKSFKLTQLTKVWLQSEEGASLVSPAQLTQDMLGETAIYRQKEGVIEEMLINLPETAN